MPLDITALQSLAQASAAQPPLPESEIADAEKHFGFRLPDPVRQFYSQVSAGGYGPGYGFYGLTRGTETFPDETVLSLYTIFRKGDPDEPEFVWPHMLLPILDWGCAIRTCVDCSTPSLPMIRFDPNEEGADQFYPENFDFEMWLQAWLDGYDHWKNE